MEFKEDWKKLYFEQKDLTRAYKEWCDELKKENLMLREALYDKSVKNIAKLTL